MTARIHGAQPGRDAGLGMEEGLEGIHMMWMNGKDSPWRCNIMKEDSFGCPLLFYKFFSIQGYG